MAKYKKKPIAIEAFQYNGDFINSNGELHVPEWAQQAFEKGIMWFGTLKIDEPSCELFIDTLEGTHHVSVGDYVIKGVKGELCPCKPDIFHQTYELVSEE